MKLGTPSPAATEGDIVAALKAALYPVPVWWGYAPAEDAETPPSLPLVAVLRTLATVTPWEDMCEEPPAVTLADVTLRVNLWHPNYAEARALQTTIRAAMRTLPGWMETSEADARDADLRAFSISSDWLAFALPLD